MNNETDNKYPYEQNLEIEGAEESVPSESTELTVPPPKKKKRRKKHYTLKFLIFVVLCVAVYFFLHSAVFTVEKITISENDHITLKQAKQVTGLKKGINLFEFDAGDCEDKLMEDPYIKEADVKRKLPDTIQIQLEMREPAAVIKYGKKYALIAKEGIVLEIAEVEPQYTVFDGLTASSAKAGQQIQVKEEKLYGKYMELLTEMEAADLYFKRFEQDGKIMRLYARDKLYCEGSMDNLITGMKDGNLQAVIWDLMQKEVKKGVITVGDQQYYSFQKTLNNSKKESEKE